MKGFALVLALAVVGWAAAVEKEAVKAVGDEVASDDRDTRSPSFLASSIPRQSNHVNNDYAAKKQQGQHQGGVRTPNQHNSQGFGGPLQNQNTQQQGSNQQGFQPNQQGTQFLGLSGSGNNQGFQGQFLGSPGFGNNQNQQAQFAGQFGFGNNQNQQGQFPRQTGFGNNQNQQGQFQGQSGFGNNQNQQGQFAGQSGLGNNQNQQGQFQGQSGFGNNQNQQGQFAGQSAFGNNQNQQGQFSGNNVNQQGQFSGNNQNQQGPFFGNTQNQLGRFNRFLQPNQFINQNQQPIVGLFSNSPSARSCVNSNTPNCNQANQATHLGVFYPISRQATSG